MRFLPWALVFAVALSSCAKLGIGGKAEEKKKDEPFGPTGIPPQLRAKNSDAGTPVVAGGNVPGKTPALNFTPEEDIVYTDPDNPDAERSRALHAARQLQARAVGGKRNHRQTTLRARGQAAADLVHRLRDQSDVQGAEPGAFLHQRLRQLGHRKAGASAGGRKREDHRSRPRPRELRKTGGWRSRTTARISKSATRSWAIRR